MADKVKTVRVVFIHTGLAFTSPSTAVLIGSQSVVCNYILDGSLVSRVRLSSKSED